MAENRHKTGKKKGGKKKIKDNNIAEEITKVKPRKKKNQKKKISKKIKTKRKKKANNFENKVIDILEKVAAKTPEDTISNPLEKLSEPEDIGKNQKPITAFDSFLHDAPITNFFIILFILSIILFMVVGYFFPATYEDIAKNKVIWTNDEGYDRGLFNQFYTSIAFTLGVFLLGYYLNATFIRFNVRKWNYFAIGILLMFFFGLGKIGELVYNHDIFSGFKDLVLTIALTMLAYASHKIYKDMNGV